MNLPVNGEHYEIAAGPYRAAVTEAGASLRELTHDGRDVVLPHGRDEPVPAALGQLLVPWPNRIDGGRYLFDGGEHQLDLSEPGNGCAIHGLVRWSPWTLADSAPDRVRLVHRLLGAAGYPFRLDLEAEYSLDADAGLTVRLTARNPGTRAAPYGHGAHPYLTVGAPLDECTATLDADAWLPVDHRKIPTGPAEDVEGTEHDLRDGPVLGSRAIDNAYTGLNRDDRGRAWLTLRGNGRASSLWVDDTHPWLEVYTADDVPGDRRRHGLGAEPMTCPPNGFATKTGVIRLEPGAQHTGSWGIMAG